MDNFMKTCCVTAVHIQPSEEMKKDEALHGEKKELPEGQIYFNPYVTNIIN